MTYFAQIDENNIVTLVIVAEQDFIDSGAVGDSSKWIETSKSDHGGLHCDFEGYPDGGVALRKNAAVIGGTYNESIDGFVPPKEQWQTSWILNETTGLWDAPIPHPGGRQEWNEDIQNWVEVPKEV